MFRYDNLDWFFKSIDTHKVARYPLTNLGIDKNDVLRIEIAAAGFKKENIEIELRGNELHIMGGTTNEKDVEEIDYIQQHISKNSFDRVLILHKNYLDGDISANMEDGILSIKIQPKERVKKKIEIS